MTRGRPIRGFFGGLLLGICVDLDLFFAGIVKLQSPVLTILPLVLCIVFLGLGATRAQRRGDHPETDHVDRVRHVEARLFLSEDHLLHGRAVAAAELGLPGDAREPGVELQRLPPPGALEVVGTTGLEHRVLVGGGAGDGGSVRLEPLATFRTPSRFFG